MFSMNFIRVVALLALTPFLGGGCAETAREFWDKAAAVISTVQDGLAKAKAAAKQQCAAVESVANESARLALMQPPGKACKAKNVTEGLAASIRSACAPGGAIDQASVLRIVTIGRGLIDAYRQAEQAKNAGC